MDVLGSPSGCARRTPLAVVAFGVLSVLVEDERLRKYAISGGSAIVGTRANNGHEFHHFCFKTKNLTNKSFAKSRLRLSKVK